MKRFMSLAIVLAMLAPLAVADANAATKKKTTGAKVAGFVQTAPLSGGTIKNRNTIGERQYLSYRDNTQKLFARIELNSPGR
jgi:hypothetical protein